MQIREQPSEPQDRQALLPHGTVGGVGEHTCDPQHIGSLSQERGECQASLGHRERSASKTQNKREKGGKGKTQKPGGRKEKCKPPFSLSQGEETGLWGKKG